MGFPGFGAGAGDDRNRSELPVRAELAVALARRRGADCRRPTRRTSAAKLTRAALGLAADAGRRQFSAALAPG
jgi:hypothetical protein